MGILEILKQMVINMGTLMGQEKILLHLLISRKSRNLCLFAWNQRKYYNPQQLRFNKFYSYLLFYRKD